MTADHQKEVTEQRELFEARISDLSDKMWKRERQIDWFEGRLQMSKAEMEAMTIVQEKKLSAMTMEAKEKEWKLNLQLEWFDHMLQMTKDDIAKQQEVELAKIEQESNAMHKELTDKLWKKERQIDWFEGALRMARSDMEVMQSSAICSQREQTTVGAAEEEEKLALLRQITSLSSKIAADKEEIETLQNQVAEMNTMLGGEKGQALISTSIFHGFIGELENSKSTLEEKLEETQQALLRAEADRAKSLENEVRSDKLLVQARASLNEEQAKGAMALKTLENAEKKLTEVMMEKERGNEAIKQCQALRSEMEAVTIAHRKMMAECLERLDELKAKLKDHDFVTSEAELKKERQQVSELRSELHKYKEYFESTGSARPVGKTGGHSSSTSDTKLPSKPDELRHLITQLQRDKFELETKFSQLEKENLQTKAAFESWKSDALAGYIGMHKTGESGTPLTSPRSSHTRAVSLSSASPFNKAEQTPTKTSGGFLSKFKSPSKSAVPDDYESRIKAVLEETLMKNVQLQTDLSILGTQSQEQGKQLRAYERKLREAGLIDVDSITIPAAVDPRRSLQKELEAAASEAPAVVSSPTSVPAVTQILSSLAQADSIFVPIYYSLSEPVPITQEARQAETPSVYPAPTAQPLKTDLIPTNDPFFSYVANLAHTPWSEVAQPLSITPSASPQTQIPQLSPSPASSALEGYVQEKEPFFFVPIYYNMPETAPETSTIEKIEFFFVPILYSMPCGVPAKESELPPKEAQQQQDASLPASTPVTPPPILAPEKLTVEETPPQKTEEFLFVPIYYTMPQPVQEDSATPKEEFFFVPIYW